MDRDQLRAIGAEAAFLDRALGGVLAELEAEEMVRAIMVSRNGKLTDREAVLVITKIDALRQVRDRIKSRIRVGEKA